MRIWDIHPGYLNRQSLLGEHRELHGIFSIIVNHKQGYSRHPETLRWVGYGWALRQRHQLLSAEMTLRGYSDRSPVDSVDNPNEWPDVYIDEPSSQFEILSEKYRDKEQGRIPLPVNAQHLWSHHKYSVMARDVNLYRSLGREVSSAKASDDFSALSLHLVEVLRNKPSPGGVLNTLQHMWGYVSDYNSVDAKELHGWPMGQLLKEIQSRVMENGETYLMASTALSELSLFAEMQ